MKFNYTNILLFPLSLNILLSSQVYNQRNHYITHHTPKTNTRTLCECELYAQSNYDNDPEMKAVMQGFDRQTSERFHEYDERMKTTRQKCREQCDKEIQKIILKDKLEKELMDKFATLQTDIQNDAIPTCVCEKSLADKVEKGCLKCAQNLGGIVVPSSGVLGGIGEFGLSVWKPAALAAAKEFAEKAGAAQGAVAGKAAGMRVVIGVLEKKGIAQYCPNIFQSIQKIENFTELKDFIGPIINKHGEICAMSASGGSANGPMCTKFDIALGLRNASGTQIGPPPKEFIKTLLDFLAGKAKTTAKGAAEAKSTKVAAEIAQQQTAVINTIYGSWETTITASIIAIVVIVLIMVIIYMILRHRRKKKMKKKLQYIKLLEE